MDRLLSAIPGVVWPAVPAAAGATMLATLFQLERSQWWPQSRLWEHQRSQLAQLLRHAVDTCPYYAKFLGEALARLPGDFSQAQFSRLPILTRAHVQRHLDDIRSRRVPPQHGQVLADGTSGSTGEPVRFFTTDLARFFWQAFNLRDHLWHARDFSLKMASIRAAGTAVTMNNWFGEIGETTLQTGPCVSISPDLSTEHQAHRVIEEDPAYLTGYPNNLLAILDCIDRLDARLPGLRQVRSFGEMLPAWARSHVARRWNVPLIDLYSTSETGYIAVECPTGNGYHIQSEGVYVEIIDVAGKPCQAGDIGRVVVTPLHNFAFPLLRYELGDYAEVGAACPCGRGLPSITRIVGRSRNMLRLPDGSRRYPRLGTERYRKIAPVSGYQVIQHNYEELEIKLSAERPLTDQELHTLGEHILENLGHPFRLRWTFLPEIPLNKGGKFEDFIAFDD